MANGFAEVVVVPAIGRVMQFRRQGETDGPFWENRNLDGRSPDPNSTEWGNFGGDKTWPAPQGEWPKVGKRAWPPPPAFDSMPVEATINHAKGTVLLTSAVDPWYGIRTRRLLSLIPGETTLRITTTYEKVEGTPVRVGVWVITQLKDPEAVIIPVPKRSPYPEGYNRQSEKLPLNLQRMEDFLTLQRSPKDSTKIGNDAGALLWVGRRDMVLVESPRSRGGEYPDQGSSAEVYTNPDPLTYVELELLGPLKNLKVGSKMERTVTYRIFARKRNDPLAEARAIFSK